MTVYTCAMGDVPGRYQFIMADPNWKFTAWSARGLGKSPEQHYACAPLDQIKAMPVSALAADDCMLWLWATNPMLPQAIEVLAAWGFAYSTAGHWVKQTKTGKLAFGTGYRLRSAGEPFLIGTRGKPKNTHSVRSVIMGPVREHSRKPEEAYAAAEALMPDAKRIDLYSRQTRSGWDSWGDEAYKFDVI